MDWFLGIAWFLGLVAIVIATLRLARALPVLYASIGPRMRRWRRRLRARRRLARMRALRRATRIGGTTSLPSPRSSRPIALLVLIAAASVGLFLLAGVTVKAIRPSIALRDVPVPHPSLYAGFEERPSPLKDEAREWLKTYSSLPREVPATITPAAFPPTSTLDAPPPKGRSSFLSDVTAYYGPCRGQMKYVYGSYEKDVEVNGSGIFTKSGARVDFGHVAADPSIPFGTRLVIPGYNLGITPRPVSEVQDRGSAIVGTRLDVFMGWCDEGRERAEKWGKHTVLVERLD